MNEINNKIQAVKTDAWSDLKKYTNARIALGRAGSSMPIKNLLDFKMSHAYARDAVFSMLDINSLRAMLQEFNLPVYILKSKAADKNEFLKRPDYGRSLDNESRSKITSANAKSFDVCITIADGLSAIAVNTHLSKILSLLMPLINTNNLSVAPFCIVEYGRVAIADEVASLLKAKLSLILIGERPGLSSPDSLGAYITYDPKVGLTDESRNCVSNIHSNGLLYETAANKIFYLIQSALQLHSSGVKLKEDNFSTEKFFLK